MFHHDPAHTGYSTSSALKTPVVLWTAPKGYGGAPVVANGYVYLLDVGHLYCVRASDGHQVWNQSLPSGLPNSCLAVYEGYVYTPLIAYNASTGELVLNYANYQGYSSPTVTEGIIYFGSDFGKSLFALNATTGSKIWNYKTGGEVTSSPAVAYGRVYFESWDGNIYALDAYTGKKIWNYTVEGEAGYFAVAGGIVYVGSYKPGAASGSPDADGAIYALKPPVTSPSPSTALSAWQLIVIVVVVVIAILAILLLVYRIRRKGAKSPPSAQPLPKP
jgi:outer membrane protein assembly factor BamB